MIQLLVEYGAKVDVWDNSRKTVLQVAISKDNDEVARLLAEYDADTSDLETSQREISNPQDREPGDCGESVRGPEEDPEQGSIVEAAETVVHEISSSGHTVGTAGSTGEQDMIDDTREERMEDDLVIYLVDTEDKEKQPTPHKLLKQLNHNVPHQRLQMMQVSLRQYATGIELGVFLTTYCLPLYRFLTTCT